MISMNVCGDQKEKWIQIHGYGCFVVEWVKEVTDCHDYYASSPTDTEQGFHILMKNPFDGRSAFLEVFTTNPEEFMHHDVQIELVKNDRVYLLQRVYPVADLHIVCRLKRIGDSHPDFIKTMRPGIQFKQIVEDSKP